MPSAEPAPSIDIDVDLAGRPVHVPTERARAGVRLPRNHSQRFALNDEVHARPPERLGVPARVSYMSFLTNSKQRQETWDALHTLVSSYGLTSTSPYTDHYTADLGPFRLKAERHTEFVRFKFIVPGLGTGGEDDPFADPAVLAVPGDWIASLPGELLVATHVAILRGSASPPDPAALANGVFAREVVIGAAIAGGAGSAFTDWKIRGDGFGRLLIVDRGMTQGQIGRALQRLLEMDTYRMMALLAYPIARTLMPALTALEQELAGTTKALVNAGEQDEPALLERLTKLAAQIESQQSQTLFRFAASASYYELVQRRVHELREERIEGLQTFKEFTERRLAPAMHTCVSVAALQDALSSRVTRATDLLSTRVDLSSERQSHELLASMNRRAQLQIRLQETVEGLSVAAVTYYVVGLVGHAAEGLDAVGVHIKAAIAMGVAIPIVALFVAISVRRIRRKVTQGTKDPRARGHGSVL